MIRKRCLAAAVAAILCTGAALANEAPPAAAPEVFAPGEISGTSPVDCLAFTPDGATVFFDQQSWPDGMIMVSHREGGHWTTPQIAPFSGRWHDHDPAVAPDGSFVIYTSDRPDAAGGEPLHGGHLWKVLRQGDGWSDPVRLPDIVNTNTRVFAPAVDAHGDIYFQRSDPPDRAFHIYRSAFVDGHYRTPVRQELGRANSHEQDPAVAPDESFIVFDAGSNDSDKPDRLYIAFKEGDHWSAPVDLGDAINRYQPWGSHLGADGRTLYFTSNHALDVSYPRSPAQAQADLARMRSWDNGVNHIWSVSLAPWLDAHRARRD
jgi:hypothetical protein